jgi:hypothetical protein
MSVLADITYVAFYFAFGGSKMPGFIGFLEFCFRFTNTIAHTTQKAMEFRKDVVSRLSAALRVL